MLLAVNKPRLPKMHFPLLLIATLSSFYTCSSNMYDSELAAVTNFIKSMSGLTKINGPLCKNGASQMTLLEGVEYTCVMNE